MLCLALFGLASATNPMVEDERELRAKAKKDARSPGDLRGCIEDALGSGPSAKKMGPKPKRYLEQEENSNSVMDEFIQGYLDYFGNGHDGDEDAEDIELGDGNYYDYEDYYADESSSTKEYYDFGRGLSSDICGIVTPDMQRKVSIDSSYVFVNDSNWKTLSNLLKFDFFAILNRSMIAFNTLNDLLIFVKTQSLQHRHQIRHAIQHRAQPMLQDPELYPLTLQRKNPPTFQPTIPQNSRPISRRMLQQILRQSVQDLESCLLILQRVNHRMDQAILRVIVPHWLL